LAGDTKPLPDHNHCWPEAESAIIIPVSPVVRIPASMVCSALLSRGMSTPFVVELMVRTAFVSGVLVPIPIWPKLA